MTARPPTAAEETALATLLTLAAAQCEPGPGGLARIRHLIDKQNGAPGWTPGTPPQQAVHLEGATAMHLLTTEGTPRGKQMAAAFALFHLLEAHVPDADWTIDEGGHLCGHVTRRQDREARAAMRLFATFFGGRLTASQGRDDRSEWIHLEVYRTGAGEPVTYRGVPVTVWTHVDIRPIAAGVKA
ncbi:hypothetical protein [Actinomadura sp. 21ATH]|uniref:hypothetical protein n=1 Tax=Actinomadura sp. 21ATH TaxID=1735444 RepID=UPI0035BF4349